jgi:ribosomal protein S18 acetylase RimI-like enzyme
VAESEGELLGYALFYPVFGSFRARWRLWLEDLWVEPAARGRGVGERLLAEVARLARERGFRSVDWEVIEWNDPALEFYRHLGGHDLGQGWLRYRLDGDALEALAETGGE